MGPFTRNHPIGSGAYAFLCRQWQGLHRDFENSGSCLVAISFENIERMQQREGWIIEHLSNCRITNALMIRKRIDFEPECWVRCHYTGYRKAFASFLKQYYPEFCSVLSTSVHVDHLEPQYRFQINSNYFVRLHLIPKKINATFGAGVERSFFRAEREKQPQGFVHMSWLAFCKASGVKPPTKSSGSLEWRVWARHQAEAYSKYSQLSVSEAYVGFLSVLCLAYTGHYAEEENGLDMDKMIHDSERLLLQSSIVGSVNS